MQMVNIIIFAVILMVVIAVPIYGLYLHSVTHPDVIAKQAAARGMTVVSANAEAATSIIFPGTYYVVKLKSLDGTKTATAQAYFPTGAKSLRWTRWDEALE